jgi:endonuclease/exonuclease/phosphatase family metal-dependent hydrolase
MRKWIALLAAVATMVGTAALSSSGDAQASPTADAPCGARVSRVNGTAVHWFAAPPEDTDRLESWCRAVGAPLIVTALNRGSRGVPSLLDLVVVTWNAHLADGQLTHLIADLRAGALTDGQPVEHFVLLVQELYRRGEDVPDFAPNARSAYAILPRDPSAPDATDYARELGLSIAYVPSMRNGAELKEDRGNAIISSEPLDDVFALELPFERQRRVVAGAAITIHAGQQTKRLQLVDTHLEPLASPSNLWIFRNPRRRQVAAILDLMQQPRFQQDSVGTVIGGDFNTVQGGARESAYRRIRAWSRSLRTEDPRSTHLMGRLDYVFARLSPEWSVTTTRISEKYGSDHHPVLARFHRAEDALR